MPQSRRQDRHAPHGCHRRARDDVHGRAFQFRGVLAGLSPRLIEPGRMTVASFLKSQGYATACIGKWHLGMDWVKLPGKDVSELNIETVEQVHSVDYSK